MLLDSSAVIAESLAFFTQELRMDLGLIGHVQTIRFLEGSLLVWIDVDVAFNALLTVIRPRVAGHPLSFALWTFVLAEAALLSLVRSLPFSFWTGLWAISYVVALFEAQVTKIVRRWNFTILLILLRVQWKQWMLLVMMMLLQMMLMIQ